MRPLRGVDVVAHLQGRVVCRVFTGLHARPERALDADLDRTPEIGRAFVLRRSPRGVDRMAGELRQRDDVWPKLCMQLLQLGAKLPAQRGTRKVARAVE